MGVDRRAAASAIEAFLRAIGRDPTAEPHLQGTGERVAAAFVDEVCEGYAVDAEALLASSTMSTTANDLVVMRDAPVTTMCPHHLMPAKGIAWVAFAPRGTIAGLGALIQVVDAFAHRLTLQEEITERVADILFKVLQPEWAGVRLVLEHGCVVARGERRHGARVETLALRGDPTGDARRTAERALGLGT